MEISLDKIKLQNGGAEEFSNKMCVMNVVAWLAKEKECTDTPKCACPVIARLAMAVNDTKWGVDNRTKHMLPLAAKIINTKASFKVMKRRAQRMRKFLFDEVAPRFIAKSPKNEQPRMQEAIQLLKDGKNIPNFEDFHYDFCDLVDRLERTKTFKSIQQCTLVTDDLFSEFDYVCTNSNIDFQIAACKLIEELCEMTEPSLAGR